MIDITWDMIEKAMKNCEFVRIEPLEHMPDEAIRVIKKLTKIEPWAGQREVIVRCDYKSSRRIAAALMAISIERKVCIGAYEAEISSCAPFVGYRYSEENGALTLFVDDAFCKEFTPATVQYIDEIGKWDELLRRDAKECEEHG